MLANRNMPNMWHDWRAQSTINMAGMFFDSKKIVVLVEKPPRKVGWGEVPRVVIF